MSDGKQCLLYMVKIPYMEAGIVIMTDFSIVEKQKSAHFGWTKSQVRPTFFGQLLLAKQERREERLQERKEREREKRRKKKEGIFPGLLSLERDNI